MGAIKGTLTMEHEVEAWLIECWRPGRRSTFATVDKDDNSWWPATQWAGVTRTPLGRVGQVELLHGIPQPGRLPDSADEGRK